MLAEGPLAPTPGVEMPDPTRLNVLYVECRWEQLFVDLVVRIAAELQTPAWVVDSNDVTWPALSIDPARLTL